MTTNNTKHEMLKLAKQIANKEYEGKSGIIRGLDGSICGGSYYPPSYFMKLDIDKILEEHPEFDANTFRGMVKEIQIRNKNASAS